MFKGVQVVAKRSLEHIVFHQANPLVIRKVCEHFKILDKTAIVGEQFGNLAGCSIGCALQHRLEKADTLPQAGDKVLGYALGACTGNTHGIFILECEIWGEDAPCQAEEEI